MIGVKFVFRLQKVNEVTLKSIKAMFNKTRHFSILLSRSPYIPKILEAFDELLATAAN